MKKIIKSIFIAGNLIEISDKEIRNLFDRREWKTIIFTEYEKEKLKIRDSIYVIFDDNETIPKGEKIILKNTTKTILGEGTYEGNKIIDGINLSVIKNLGIYRNDDLYEHNDPLCLFKIMDNSNYKPKEVEQIKQIYSSGLFRIYYTMLDYNMKYLSKNVENKYSAMCSYLALNDCLKKYGIILSYPNCFIKGYKLEYDALILKEKSYEYFHNLDDNLLATVEIKVCGCFYKNEEREKEFNKYLMKQHGIIIADEKNGLEYDDYSQELTIPHIYFTFHESYKNYKTYLEVIQNLKEGYMGIFCSLKDGNDQFIVPKDYDIEIIIDKLKEIIKK